MAIEESEIQEQAEAEALHGDEGGAAAAPVPHPLRERVEELGKLKEAALHAGSPAAIERQHARGKLTARERLEILLDPGSRGTTVAFVHPKGAFGTLIELVEDPLNDR